MLDSFICDDVNVSLHSCKEAKALSDLIILSENTVFTWAKKRVNEAYLTLNDVSTEFKCFMVRKLLISLKFLMIFVGVCLIQGYSSPS